MRGDLNVGVREDWVPREPGTDEGNIKSIEKESSQARKKIKDSEVGSEGGVDSEIGGERRLNRSKASQDRADRRIRRVNRSRSDQSDTEREEGGVGGEREEGEEQGGDENSDADDTNDDYYEG